MVTCRRRHDDDVTVTSSCLMVDYVTDVIRPCLLEVMSLDYVRVTPDNRYLVGVDQRRSRLTVYAVDKHGKHGCIKKNLS